MHHDRYAGLPVERTISTSDPTLLESNNVPSLVK